MHEEGTDLPVSPWSHLVGAERRRYFWAWEDGWVAALAAECIAELQERGVMWEVALAAQSATPSNSVPETHSVT